MVSTAKSEELYNLEIKRKVKEEQKVLEWQLSDKEKQIINMLDARRKGCESP